MRLSALAALRRDREQVGLQEVGGMCYLHHAVEMHTDWIRCSAPLGCLLCSLLLTLYCRKLVLFGPLDSGGRKGEGVQTQWMRSRRIPTACCRTVKLGPLPIWTWALLYYLVTR
jgi:hypothetical protein